MFTVKQILELIDVLAPFETAEEWDNSGLLIGNPNQPVSRILLALDVNEEVVHEAISQKYDLIIVHHPMIFKGIKQITSESRVGKLSMALIKAGISVIAAHTNLDRSFDYGINTYVGRRLNLKNMSALGPYGIVGELEPKKSLSDLLMALKSIFKIEIVKVAPYVDALYQDVISEKPLMIQRVAFSSGASMDFLEDALAVGAEVFITSDIKYHEAQNAIGGSCILIDVGHFESESVYLPYFRDLILKKLIESHPESDDPIYVHVASEEKPIFTYF